MASIADFVAKIRAAVYGKDVRESIAAAIEAINEESVTAKECAASAASSAASSAGSAAAAKLVADRSAENANTAAQTANTAANNADGKAQAAQEAEEAAQTAKQNADTATKNANDAASAANTAAINADTKAQAAETAADEANAAKENADRATEAANTAAGNASAQADYAKEQGDRAKKAAEGLESTDPGAAQKVQENLDTHTKNQNNPHGVTAAQVGAVPTTRKINGYTLSEDVELTPNDAGGIWYGTCETENKTAAKAVTCPGFKLVDGAMIRVRFMKGLGDVSTLDVNNTGAHSTRSASYMSLSNVTQGGGFLDFVYVASDGFWYAVIPGSASTSMRGITFLSNSVDSSSQDRAATPYAVKQAYDRAGTLMNRSTAVNTADTNYTTYMARGEALFPSETTPTVNGAIAWQYS